jgi:2,4-dienoyl-CoA reductase-like NADH-dependent reductase (Old Yellow Enzyme family)
MEDLIENHVDAAESAREAGFDFVEVKACHGYLLSSSISPHSNRSRAVKTGNPWI